MRIIDMAAVVVLTLLAFCTDSFAFDISTADRAAGPGATATSDAMKPAYPLKVSANNRYLVGRDGTPFLMVGNFPQNLIGNLSKDEAATFIGNRAMYGINALWINLLCNDALGCRPDSATPDGIVPFTVPGDLATPNAQAVATNKASSLPVSLRSAPGRGSSLSARSRLPSTKRRLVRYTVEPPTPTLLAISSSPARHRQPTKSVLA